MVRLQKGDDNDLEDFITKIGNSFVKIELIKFFYYNPHFLGTVQDLSLAIGRDPAKVSKEIRDLIAAGMIQKSGPKDAPLWSYGPDRLLHEKVVLFIQAYEKRDIREWIVNEVIRRKARK